MVHLNRFSLLLWQRTYVREQPKNKKKWKKKWGRRKTISSSHSILNIESRQTFFHINTFLLLRTFYVSYSTYKKSLKNLLFLSSSSIEEAQGSRTSERKGQRRKKGFFVSFQTSTTRISLSTKYPYQ